MAATSRRGSLAIEWMADNPETAGQVPQLVERARNDLGQGAGDRPVASHASWMENFPWTRLPGVTQPSAAEADDRPGPHAADDVRRRCAHYLGDGNFGGYYERPDEDMLAIWAGRGRGDARAARRPVGMSDADPDLGRGRDRRHARRVLHPRRPRRAVRRQRGRARRGDQRATACRSPGRSTSSRCRRRRSLPGRARRARSSAILLASRRRTRRGAARALRRHLADDGYVVSAQNGLNELVIADVVGERADDRLLRQFRRRLPGAGVVHYGGHGAVVVGELDGTHHAAHRGAAPPDARFRPEGRAHRQHLGLSLGQADLRRAAVRHRPHQRIDRRRAGRCRSYRPMLHRAGARGRRGRAGERRQARARSTASIRAPSCRARRRAAAERSFDGMVAHNRRSAKSHSGIWRDLAVRKRKTEVDAQLGRSSSRSARGSACATPLTAPPGRR